MDMKYLYLGGYDNVCFDVMLLLDVVFLRC